MTASNLLRLAAVGAAALAFAACTPRPATDSAAGNDIPNGGATNPQYPGAGTGAVDGGALGAAAPGSEQDFVVNVGDRVYFDLDSYQIRSEAFPRLDAQVAWLQRYPNVTVRIEGNADERGTREYNLALGARRAKAVRDALVALGVSASRLSTVSYGEELPICHEATESCWGRNRRGHIVDLTE